MYQFEKLYDETFLNAFYCASDFELFSSNMGLGVDLFVTDALAFTLDRDLVFAVREEVVSTSIFLFSSLAMVMI